MTNGGAGSETPDILVLGGGGILGEVWMNAVLAGLDEADGFDACGCAGYIGTSAGSIVATALVAGIRPRERLGSLPEQPAVAERDVEETSEIRRAAREDGMRFLRDVRPSRGSHAGVARWRSSAPGSRVWE